MNNYKFSSGDCRFVRQTLGLNQEKFAKLMGVQQSLVSRWEKQGPVLKENIDKLNVLLLEIKNPESLEKIKKLISEGELETVSSLLNFAGKGMGREGLRSAISIHALSGVGLFGAGLLAMGGALGTYKILKKIFEEDKSKDS
jgi:transcriptional regulator with XRE-family HTH domain